MPLNNEYHAYINSLRWKAKCKQYWDARGRFCKACHSTQRLVVHHLSYDNFGYEPLYDLVGLCHTCHLEVHRRHRRSGRRVAIRDITNQYIKEMALNRLRRKTT